MRLEPFAHLTAGLRAIGRAVTYECYSRTNHASADYDGHSCRDGRSDTPAHWDCLMIVGIRIPRCLIYNN